jgi:hypothetical protein
MSSVAIGIAIYKQNGRLIDQNEKIIAIGQEANRLKEIELAAQYPQHIKEIKEKNKN